MADDARKQRQVGNDGGLGLIFAIMFFVIAGVAGGAYFMYGGQQPAPEPPEQVAPREISVSRSNKPFPQVDPWEGEIAGVEGAVRVGMTRQELVDQFGMPHTVETDFDRTDQGVDQLEWYDVTGDSRGTFNSGQGVRLIVKLDRAQACSGGIAREAQGKPAIATTGPPIQMDTRTLNAIHRQLTQSHIFSRENGIFRVIGPAPCKKMGFFY